MAQAKGIQLQDFADMLLDAWDIPLAHQADTFQQQDWDIHKVKVDTSQDEEDTRQEDMHEEDKQTAEDK